MKYLRFLLCIVALTLGLKNAKASHIIGGEITWDCQGDGTYIFYLTVYRDCQGQSQIQFARIYVWNHPTLDSIPVTLFSQTDISPTCNMSFGGQQLSCGVSSPLGGAVEKRVYKSAPVALNGVPPPEGWIFTYHQCCRNAGIINLLNSQNEGTTMRSKMFANQGANGDPCLDSSPQFADNPVTAVCIGQAVYDYNFAYDIDGDSLSYEWAKPLETFDGLTFGYDESIPSPPYAPFVNGYSFDSPFPDTNINPNNQPAVLDAGSGELTFRSYTQGYVAYVLKVTSWRNGNIVSEVYRDMQVMMIGNCLTESAVLQVNAPFNNPTASYTDTVWGGELVEFDFVGNANGTVQPGYIPTVTLQTAGLEYGVNFNDIQNGCPYPPCATLNSTMPISNVGSVQTHFKWQTSFNHIHNAYTLNYNSRTYRFWFKLDDGVCSLPRFTERVVNIVIRVNLEAVLYPPELNCVSAVSTNGDSGNVAISWTPAVDTLGIFSNYSIYHSQNMYGPYTLLDSVFDINQNTYVHQTQINHANYYRIKTQFFYDTSRVSSYFSNIRGQLYLTADTLFGHLIWSQVGENPDDNCQYELWRKLPDEDWQQIAIVGNQEFTDSLLGNTLTCDQQAEYKVICSSPSCPQVSNVVNSIYDDYPRSVIDTSNFQNGQVNFYSIFTSPFYNYHWDFGDSTTSIADSVEHYYQDTGHYLVTLIISNACGADTDTVSIYIPYVNSVHEIDFQKVLELFPNPTSNELNLKLKKALPNGAYLRINDILGRVEQELLLKPASKDETLKLDVGLLPKGIHLLEFEIDGKRLVSRFVKN